VTEIVIRFLDEPSSPCCIDVTVGDKKADGLTIGEAIGLIVQLLPSRDHIYLLRTPEQINAWAEKCGPEWTGTTTKSPKPLPDVTPKTEPTVS
jgi:hypothetical protein